MNFSECGSTWHGSERTRPSEGLESPAKPCGGKPAVSISKVLDRVVFVPFSPCVGAVPAPLQT